MFVHGSDPWLKTSRVPIQIFYRLKPLTYHSNGGVTIGIKILSNTIVLKHGDQ